MNDGVIESYDEDAEVKSWWNKSFNEKKQPMKSKSSIFYLQFY